MTAQKIRPTIPPWVDIMKTEENCRDLQPRSENRRR